MTDQRLVIVSNRGPAEFERAPAASGSCGAAAAGW